MIPRSRCLVLGLDGLPLSLARELGDRLPNLGRLAADPRATTIRAELPELSPVNWTSFATAKGPGEHGVFGFVRIDPATYALSLTDATQVATPLIFDRLGRLGLSSRVVNLPNTYPARAMPGMLVSGFVAEDLSRAVFPPFLLGPLAAAGYRLEADTTRGAGDPDFLLSELRATLRSRAAALDLLWPDLCFDLFVLVLTETDRLFHFLFPAVRDRGHALHSACLEFLREWDRLLGRILSRFDDLPEPKRLVVLADHGFTELKIEVDLNCWLSSQGLLRLLPARNGEACAELDAARIAQDSKAFALDPGRIYLHTQRRFARGRLSSAEAARLRERIREALLALTFEGERVMEGVFAAGDIYAGPCLDRAPDLVCLGRPGFDLKAKFNRREIFGRFGRLGTHTADGAFFFDTQGERPASLKDAGALVLRHFGAHP